MMNQSSSNEKQRNMWHQTASSASTPEDQICKIYHTLADMQLCPTYKRWCHELRKGILFKSATQYFFLLKIFAFNKSKS